MPSDHIGLEEKRLQLQPRSPLGKVLAGRTSNQTEACLVLSYFIPRFSLHQRVGKDTWIGTLSLMCVDLARCLDTLEQDTTCQYKNVVNTTQQENTRSNKNVFLEKAIFWGDMIFKGEVIFGEKPFLGRSPF